MKICICVSGQIRDNTEVSFIAMQTLADNLRRQGVEVSLVFSIWSEISRKLEGIINLKQLYKMFHADVVPLIPPSWYGKTFWDHLPKSYQSIVAGEAQDAEQYVRGFFPEAIIDVESGQLLDLRLYNTPTNDINSKRMLYKVWRANEIKKKLEWDQGQPFDFVIRVRPDYSIKTIPLDADPGCLYIPNGKEDHSVLEDTFAMGSSQAIDYYSELFASSLSSTSRWRGIHYMLSDHIKAAPFPLSVKSAQNSGFHLRHMTHNTELLDLSDLGEDLNSPFYHGLFKVIRSQRSGDQRQLADSFDDMAALFPLIEEQDQRLIYFMLLYAMYQSRGDHCAALKALALADLNHSRIDPKRFALDHRVNYLFEHLLKNMSASGLGYGEDCIRRLHDRECSPWIDQVFREQISDTLQQNLDIFAASERGQGLLRQASLI